MHHIGRYHVPGQLRLQILLKLLFKSRFAVLRGVRADDIFAHFDIYDPEYDSRLDVGMANDLRLMGRCVEQRS